MEDPERRKDVLIVVPPGPGAAPPLPPLPRPPPMDWLRRRLKRLGEENPSGYREAEAEGSLQGSLSIEPLGAVASSPGCNPLWLYPPLGSDGEISLPSASFPNGAKLSFPNGTKLSNGSLLLFGDSFLRPTKLLRMDSVSESYRRAAKAVRVWGNAGLK